MDGNETVYPEIDTSLIGKLTNDSYRKIASDRGKDATEIYYSRDCEYVTEDLQTRLNTNGIDSKLAHYGGWDITSHQFLLINDKIVYDPTWQQFLENPDPDLPTALFVPVDKLEAQLEEYGIPKEKHHIWNNAIYDINGKKIKELRRSS